MDKFKSLKLNMQAVNDDVFGLRSASTTAGYDHVSSKIENRHPTAINKVATDQIAEERLAACSLPLREKKWLEDSWGGVPSNGDPMHAMMDYCARALEVIQKRKRLLQKPGWASYLVAMWSASVHSRCMHYNAQGSSNVHLKSKARPCRRCHGSRSYHCRPRPSRSRPAARPSCHVDVGGVGAGAGVGDHVDEGAVGGLAPELESATTSSAETRLGRIMWLRSFLPSGNLVRRTR
ncbi:hypothetical protein ON010_g649 [Phytophthora cinnamomi]|nr:hypothetical protein ON010_g649 [Phytophthora cinnamomi]